MKTSERKILVVKEFLFGNIQTEFKSQGLLYKVLCLELELPIKPNLICITKQKLLFENKGERERERERERKR